MIVRISHRTKYTWTHTFKTMENLPLMPMGTSMHMMRVTGRGRLMRPVKVQLKGMARVMTVIIMAMATGRLKHQGLFKTILLPIGLWWLMARVKTSMETRRDGTKLTPTWTPMRYTP